MPSLAEMRIALARQSNPIEMKNIGVNEAPGIDPKAYMSPGGVNMPPPTGGAYTKQGMPVGGIDVSRQQPGQQLQMPPQQPPQAPQQPPGQPQMPQGMQPAQGGPAMPQGPSGNILQMTRPGQMLSAMAPNTNQISSPQPMAKGGVAKANLANGGLPTSSTSAYDPEQPYAVGDLLNQMYGSLWKQQIGSVLPDMRPYGRRYAEELATARGRQNLARDIGLRDVNTSPTGIYRQGDFDFLPGMSMTDSTYAQYMPQDSRMFVPDMIEVDPGYWYRSQAAQGMSPQEQEKNWDRSYYGHRLAFSNPSGEDPEQTLRNLMNRKVKLESQQTPEAQTTLSNLYQESRAPLIGMDIGRGGLTYEQGSALDKALEYKKYLDQYRPTAERGIQSLPGEIESYQQRIAGQTDDAMREQLQREMAAKQEILDKYREGLAQYQSTFDKYNTIAQGIDTSKGELSSSPLLQYLQGKKETPPVGMASGGLAKSVDQMKQEIKQKQGVTMQSPSSTRLIFQAEGPGGVKGINVPRHMWEGSKTMGGMKEVNDARAKVYGDENRDPLTLGQIGRIHKQTLQDHFAKPVDQQVKDENDALGRLREARHIGKTANTLDESEKLDTVRHETDEQGRNYVGFASKGVAGHALYTSGSGKNQKHHVLNTCPGQTQGCGGGKDEKGVVDTTKGTCFAPVAEAQYPGAAIRRASHAQAKHDPAMTKDWILAHTGSMRDAANAADKKNLRLLFRPNVVDETDVSSRHVIKHLNDQRKSENKPPIIANSYGKTNELHDPANGYYVTHSNVGPKTKKGQSIAENIARDKQRVNSTILAADSKGRDFVNEDGDKTPPKNSYMVTDVKRDSAFNKKMEKAIKYAKYWSAGRSENELSEQEKSEGPEGHFGPTGKPTTPANAHYGHTTLNGRRYDYQKQHILHPRLVQVGHNDDGSPHMIPTDSRFKDEEFLPKNRFMTKNGKKAGAILMTTPTTSTSNVGHQTSFTHHVNEGHIEHALKHKGEYEIDSPEQQEKSMGKEYAAPQPIKFYAGGGHVAFHHKAERDDHSAFPEQSFAGQLHNAHRDLHNDVENSHHLTLHRHLAKTRGHKIVKPVMLHKNMDTMRLELTRKGK